jgi:hypothetical protein
MLTDNVHESSGGGGVGKVAVARGKWGLGKVANIDWHEISACAIPPCQTRGSCSGMKHLGRQRLARPRPPRCRESCSPSSSASIDIRCEELLT